MLSSDDGNRLRFFAFGNLAVGIIAVGNVAVGVVAIGFTAAVGPIAIGMNSAGILVGIGLNAAGNIALALINGIGLFTFAGVNGLGAFAKTFVNGGESSIVAALLLCAQAIAIVVLKPSRPLPTHELPSTTSLASLLSGDAIEGTLLAKVEPKTRNLVTVHADGQTTTALLVGSAQQTFNAVSSRERHGEFLLSVRVSTEALPGVSDADYRKAPETVRTLSIEAMGIPPRPPRFWEKPDAIKQACRASCAFGVLLSFATIVLRLFLT